MNVMNGTLLEVMSQCNLGGSVSSLELDYSVEDYYNLSRNFQDLQSLLTSYSH